MKNPPPADRSLDSLDPKYRQRFVDFLAALERTFPQFRVIVTETRRSDERQAYLRSTGASRTKRSNHQDGIAMDIALLRKATNELDWRPAVFRNIYRVVDPRKFGLTSGGMLWNGFDWVHLQIIEVQGRGEDLDPRMESYDH